MIKIPYSCIECDYLINEGICGIYSDRMYIVNLERCPPDGCPLKHLNRFEWLCNNAIKETITYENDTSTFSYKLELPLTINNSVMSTIDNTM